MGFPRFLQFLGHAQFQKKGFERPPRHNRRSGAMPKDLDFVADESSTPLTLWDAMIPSFHRKKQKRWFIMRLYGMNHDYINYMIYGYIWIIPQSNTIQWYFSWLLYGPSRPMTQFHISKNMLRSTNAINHHPPASPFL